MIDWNKPIQTRDGRPVEILSVKGRGERPVVGYMYVLDDEIETWEADGTYCGDEMKHLDLVNVPDAPTEGQNNA